jgi:hypothetical protein
MIRKSRSCRSHLPHNVLELYEFLIHLFSKWRFPRALMKWSYRSPQSCWLLSLEWLAHSEQLLQSVPKHKSFWCPFVDPHLTPYHRSLGVQVIAKLELGTSTLHCLHGQTVFNINCQVYCFCISKQYESITISVDMFGLAFFSWHVRCNPSPYIAIYFLWGQWHCW